jgi:hypothetical protein
LVSVPEYVAFGDAFVLGWVIIDYIANIILSRGETFTKIRYFGSRFVSRDKAIILSIAQVAVAMAVSYQIVDWIFYQIALFFPALVSITLAIGGIFYAYILAGLPYKITIRRASPTIVAIALGFLTNYWPEIATWIANSLIYNEGI